MYTYSMDICGIILAKESVTATFLLITPEQRVMEELNYIPGRQGVTGEHKVTVCLILVLDKS